eukprot:8181636-Pyramimonas_sp.AAC.1
MAVDTGDLAEAWARDLCAQRRADLRRQGAKLQEAVFFLHPFLASAQEQDSDEGPIRTANGRYGVYVTTAS